MDGVYEEVLKLFDFRINLRNVGYKSFRTAIDVKLTYLDNQDLG